MAKAPYFKSRKGITLVEMICSVAILAVVAVTALGAISLSRTSILKGNTEDAASAQAQQIMDVLMANLTALPDAGPDELPGDMDALGAVYSPVRPFSYEKGERQYYFQKTPVDANGVYGYNLYVAVYYSGGSGCATLNSYIPYQGGNAP